MEFFRNLTPTQILLAIIVVGIIYTIIRDIVLIFQHTSKPSLAISEILKNTLKDTSSLLAFGIGGAVIILALSEKPIPEILSNAFFIILGYYFGKGTFIKSSNE